MAASFVTKQTFFAWPVAGIQKDKEVNITGIMGRISTIYYNNYQSRIGEWAEISCPICQRFFIPSIKLRKTCSLECAQKRHQIKMYEAHKNRRGRHKRDLTPKSCKFCGVLFVPSKTRKQNYCSQLCKFKAYWTRQRMDIHGHRRRMRYLQGWRELNKKEAQIQS